MKTIWNKYFFIGILFFVFSCESKQEKLIQTEVDKIVGQWKIDSFETANTAPSEWRGLVKSGELKFDNCRAKNVKHDNSYCKAGVELNGEIYDLGYRFDTYFIFSLSPVNRDGSGKIVFSPKDALFTTLMRGKWEIVINGNTMIGKQIENPLAVDVLSIFTATRK